MGKSIFFRLAVVFIEALALQTFKKNGASDGEENE
jgi:hypothetical protein